MPVGSVAARTAEWLEKGRAGGWYGAPSSGAGGGDPATVTFGIGGTLLGLRIRIALGADLSADPSTWGWADVTERVRQPDISVTEGRRDQGSRVDTSRGVLALNNNDGLFCRRNTASPYYGLLSRNTPIWIEVDPGSGWYDLFQGFVNEWPTRWDDTLTYSMVPIACAGIMRRLSQGDVILDPIVEAVSSTTTVTSSSSSSNAVAYWPCTDAPGSTTAASAIPNVPAMTTSGTVVFGTVTDSPGTPNLPDLSGSGRLVGTIPTGTVTTEWTIECRAKGASNGSDVSYVLTVICPASASARQWTIRYEADETIDAAYYDSNDNGSTETVAQVDGYNGQVRTLQLRCKQNGGNVDMALYVDGVLKSTSSPAVTLARPTKIYLGDGRGDDLLGGGHVKFYDSFIPQTSSSSSTVTTVTTATIENNFDGELAHERMRRICAQAGIPFHCLAATSVPMGVATSNDLLGQLRECEAADGGVLYEYRWGLAYQATSERINAAVALELDFDAGHIAAPPEPADDDQTYRNQWTVTRTGGSSTTLRLDDDVIRREGLYDDAVTLNVASDINTIAQAGWRLRLDSVDEDRWPLLELHLHSTLAAGLIPTWVSLPPLGSRTTAVNLPSQCGPNASIDAFIEGRTQQVDPFSWQVALNLSPASPYDVQLLAESDSDTFAGVGRLVLDSCDLNTAVDAATTTFVLDVVPPADTTMAAGSYDMRFDAEEVQVTNVVGASSPQTFTVVRGVNGTTAAAHAAGTIGELTMPLRPVLP